MIEGVRNEAKASLRWLAVAAAVIGICVVPHLLLESHLFAYVISIAGVCLFLWISELSPPFAPTLLLWILIAVVLGRYDSRYSLPNVLAWAADPVIALFFGGFVLGVAAEKTGLAARMTDVAARVSAGSSIKLLATLMAATAFLSMWISNIAAAAVMFAAVRPLTQQRGNGDRDRRTLLVGIAFAANIGGIATPVGTGPNGIAIASVSHIASVSFVDWVVAVLPLTLGMLILAGLFLALRSGRGLYLRGPHREDAATFGNVWRFIAIFAVTVILWLTEPLHHISSAIVALGSAFAIFTVGILGPEDLKRIDWSTLLLIAGGITLGRLLEQSGIVTAATATIPFGSLHPAVTLFGLCLASATLSALMSNTATVILLIPLGTAILPGPATPILLAISASFGMPLVISTPANAMAYGEGGVRFGDMFWPGLALMMIGCGTVSLTGEQALALVGIK